MLVILNVAHGSKEQGMFAGLAIGSVVLLEAMFAVLVSGHLQSVWIYLTAPVIGAVAAVPIYAYLKGE